jgi:hypothetical protein
VKLSYHVSKLFKDSETGGLDLNRWDSLSDKDKLIQRLNYITEGAIALAQLLLNEESDDFKIPSVLMDVLRQEVIYLASTAVEAQSALDEGAHTEATGLALTTGLQLGFIKMVLSDFDRYGIKSTWRRSRRKGGVAVKRKQWAEDLAHFLAKNKWRFKQAWSSIPVDENHPLRLNEDVYVYRIEDDQRVVAFDEVSGVELGSQSYSNFSKRYFYPARKYFHSSE